jgi:hypothetical protein
MPHIAEPAPSSASIFSWQEIGRHWPTGAADWAAWMAPLGDDGDRLYRSLAFDGGAISVAVDLQAGSQSGLRPVHRGQCYLPRQSDEITKRIGLLFAAADEAAARAVSAARQENRGQETVWNAWARAEHRIRERAYFLWEQSGRPQGRADEFWERARRAEVGLATGQSS